MRDALSLLDQAIAHGAGQVLEEQVTHMLGAVGDDHLYAILDALAAGDADALIAVADGMEARSLSFDAALQALATILARVALVQFAPAALADESERAQLALHAGRFDAEYLQLAYQIAIHGRDELALAPDEYIGFTMSLLRLLAFRPEQPSPGVSQAGGAPGGAARRPPAAPAMPLPEMISECESPTESPPLPPQKPVAPSDPANGETAVAAALARTDWREAVRALGLSGLARELAQHCEWIEYTDGDLRLRLSDVYRHLLDIHGDAHARIESELGRALGRPVKLRIEIGSITGQTPAQRDELDRRARHAQAIAALESDPFVLELIERFDASLDENTARLL
jgi:DNA polymerase-3 subunit gamma/tau